MMERIKKLLRGERAVDEAKLEADARRGREARELLDSAALASTLEDIESFYVASWKRSSATDVELRERSHVAVCVLEDIRARLRAYADAGVVAEQMLERARAKR